MKSVLIIGMGSFGHHLCRCLAELDCEIMIVDRDERAIEDMLPYVVSAKIADCTNADVLKSFDVRSFDVCFVCISGDFQSGLEITNQLYELGAKRVISKADRDIEYKFLKTNGATDVVYPEKDIAHRVAVRESSDSIFDCIDLGEGCAVYEISVKDSWIGKTIKEENFRVKYNLTILAKKDKDNGKVTPIVTGDYKFNTQEHLLVMGSLSDVRKVTKK